MATGSIHFAPEGRFTSMDAVTRESGRQMFRMMLQRRSIGAAARAEHRARDWDTATRADRRAVVSAILADEDAELVAADRRFWRTWAFVLAVAMLALVAGGAL